MGKSAPHGSVCLCISHVVSRGGCRNVPRWPLFSVIHRGVARMRLRGDRVRMPSKNFLANHQLDIDDGLGFRTRDAGSITPLGSCTDNGRLLCLLPLLMQARPAHEHAGAGGIQPVACACAALPAYEASAHIAHFRPPSEGIEHLLTERAGCLRRFLSHRASSFTPSTTSRSLVPAPTTFGHCPDWLAVCSHPGQSPNRCPAHAAAGRTRAS